MNRLPGEAPSYIAIQLAFAFAALPIVTALVVAFVLRLRAPVAKAFVFGSPWIPAQLWLFVWLVDPAADPAQPANLFAWRWLRFNDPTELADIDQIRAAWASLGVWLVLVAAALLIGLRFGRRALRIGPALVSAALWLCSGGEWLSLALTVLWVARHTAYLRDSEFLRDLLVPVALALVLAALATWGAQRATVKPFE